MPKSHPLKPIAITMGDASGIGPEIILQTFLHAPHFQNKSFIVGDLACMLRAKQLFPAMSRWQVQPITNLAQVATLASQVIGLYPIGDGLSNASQPDYGVIHKTSGALAGRAIQIATQLALEQKVRALVTAPIHKTALNMAGFDFPGHTEMLQDLSCRHFGQTRAQWPVRMMVQNDQLCVVLHSIHLSLQQAITQITVPSLLETFSMT
ncbi:MAG: 4-hydroxythreonine-4-phosphate dehydrogenase PdxA, partial [Gammaproteobacteria bacterium]|nr:4-hydroxythreonine-4-phosphate dehydrogenase PdxA [Gammaproteobacteria bacterium]